jgi:hypothetical protein
LKRTKTKVDAILIRGVSYSGLLSSGFITSDNATPIGPAKLRRDFTSDRISGVQQANLKPIVKRTSILQLPTISLYISGGYIVRVFLILLLLSPYQVVAGVYDDSMTLEELNKISNP